MSAKKEITYKVAKNGCWICDSHRTDSDGYSKCQRNGYRLNVHRWVYMQYHNISKLPFDVKIRHICDTPSCINPSHLLSGSNEDNAQDMIKRGRNIRGGNCYNSKLTEKEVLEIRESVGVTLLILSQKYNVSESLISGIKLRKKWKHLK